MMDMDRLQLSRLRDIAIEYLPEAQQYREQAKALPLDEDKDRKPYAEGLWRIADKIIARPEASSAELAAAQLLLGLTSWETYDPSWPRLRDTDPAPEDMRDAMLPGIANAAKTLADITGRSIFFMGQNVSAIDWAEFMQDDRNQYLMGMPDDLDPWMLCDVWDIDTACQLITLGCKQDIEKQRVIKKQPVTAPHYHAWRARTICEVYDRAKCIAALSKVNDPDTPAQWLEWAQRIGYDVAHLMPADAPAESAPKSDNKVTSNWILLVQSEAATLWRKLKGMNCSPTKNNIKDDLAKICREKEIKTDHGIYPTAEYIYRHVLGGWTPPTD